MFTRSSGLLLIAPSPAGVLICLHILSENIAWLADRDSFIPIRPQILHTQKKPKTCQFTLYIQKLYRQSTNNTHAMLTKIKEMSLAHISSGSVSVLIRQPRSRTSVINDKFLIWYTQRKIIKFHPVEWNYIYANDSDSWNNNKNKKGRARTFCLSSTLPRYIEDVFTAGNSGKIELFGR